MAKGLPDLPPIPRKKHFPPGVPPIPPKRKAAKWIRIPYPMARMLAAEPSNFKKKYRNKKEMEEAQKLTRSMLRLLIAEQESR